MTEPHPPVDSELAEVIDRSAASWAQGDVFAEASIVRLADASAPLTADAFRAAAQGATGAIAIRVPLHLAVLLSQTCDAVRGCAQRPFVQLAPVVALDGDALIHAQKGWKPRYVPLPWLSDEHFADLDLQGTVEKSTLLACERVNSCSTPTQQIEFSARVARCFDRFAFPDDLTPTLKPLVARLRTKAGQLTPQGRRVDDVLEIRARPTPDWNADAIDVSLVFLIHPSSLAGIDDDPPTDALAELQRIDAQRLAERLDRDDLTPGLRSATWQRLVDEWARVSTPSGCIRSVTAVAVAISEFSLADSYEAPLIDLDYLSG